MAAQTRTTNRQTNENWMFRMWPELEFDSAQVWLLMEAYSEYESFELQPMLLMYSQCELAGP